MVYPRSPSSAKRWKKQNIDKRALIMQFRPLKSTAIFLWTQCTSFGAEECATCINICTAVHCGGRREDEACAVWSSPLHTPDSLRTRHFVHQKVCSPSEHQALRKPSNLRSRHNVHKTLRTPDPITAAIFCIAPLIKKCNELNFHVVKVSISEAGFELWAH